MNFPFPNRIIRSVAVLAFVFTNLMHAEPTETPEQRATRMAWWRDAKFGMFIHWGVYSVPAGFYQGKAVPGIGEWIMNKGKIPMAEYQQFAQQFNPTKFDAKKWVKIAKDAGQRYIVITSKHHDGFAMFCSKASKWNICDATPFGRDPLQELAAACDEAGIKLGFYYSQAQDWNNGGSAIGGKWDPAQEHNMDDYIDKVAAPQVSEILTNYGPNVPAVLWWDTPNDMNDARAQKLAELVSRLRPKIITNNRLAPGFAGDTETPEQRVPATGFPGRDWETCMTINGTWGYKSDDQNFKPTEKLLRNLIDIVSKGGNYLLNVGPTAEGEIPEPEIERLRQMGEWLKTNGEAVYGTTASPLAKVGWGRVTKKNTEKGTALYLQVFDWPKDGKLVVTGLKNAPKGASLLASGAAVRASTESGDVTLDVPVEAPDAVASVIKLEFDEPLHVEN
ncbi:MAG: alpha-L-fucosidase [Chthoniobacter sp.]|nr:alpha-L-fucosidase [Chthoniobacter sp.]